MEGGEQRRADSEPAHERHFTVEQANAMLPRLKPLLRELRDARDALADPDAHELLSDAAPTNGGGEAGREIGQAFLEVRRLLLAVQEIGIVLRDVDRGLVDFPALLGGREVYLCWELGEDRVEHWHDLDSGYRGRRPLEE